MKKKGKIIRGISLALAVFLLLGTVPSIAQAPGETKVPEGAIKLSEAVPAMGEHWANPRDLPLGPIYLVWQGKVIGIEYMHTLAMMTPVPAPPSPTGEPAWNYQIEGLPLFDQKIDHFTISYMPDGHEGFKVPHYDYHLYFITPAERYKIILNVPPPPAVSPVPGARKPADAEQTSAIIPRMGSHWSVPAHRPFGPIYVVDKVGKEVGIEYVYNHDKMRSRQIPEGPGGPLIWDCSIDYIPVGRAFNHMSIGYSPKGRSYPWQFEIHLYTVTREERATIAP